MNHTPLFAWESLAPDMCALALENFAVQLTTAKPYIDNDSQRPARKQRYIRAHIEQTYFANLDYFFYDALHGL